MTLLSNASKRSASSTWTTRPKTHADRDACIAFVSTLADRHDVNDTLDATLSTLRRRTDAYLAAREANAAAATRVALDRDGIGSAEVAFADAFHRWVVAVDQQRGRSGACAAELPALLGSTSAHFLRTSVRSQVARMRTVLIHAAMTPDLMGSVVALAGLRAATEALAGALGTLEADQRAHVVTQAALERTRTDFDRAYGLLVRELRYAAFEIVIPRFLAGQRAGVVAAVLPASVPAASGPPALVVVPGSRPDDAEDDGEDLADDRVDADDDGAEGDIGDLDDVDDADPTVTPVTGRSDAA